MKILIYGAGVIGCYLTHVLCRAGNDVDLLARGEWKKNLERNGLVIRHHLQRKTTVDRPNVIAKAENSVHYDAVFSVMSYHQVGAVVDDLASLDADFLVFVGNNMSAEEIESRVKKNSAFPKEILFGFQATAGKRETNRLLCERLGAGGMEIGFLHKESSAFVKEKFAWMFKNSRYKLNWRGDMESFLKCHVAAILPVAFLAYSAGCDYGKTCGAERKLCLDASAEGYDLLLRLGYSVVPAGDDKFYRGGFRRLLMKFVFFVMAKTVVGDLATSSHCRHAVSELERLDQAWIALRKKAPDFPMPNWDKLRSSMPSWNDLHKIYGGK